MVADFNIGHFTGSRGQGHIHTQEPTLKMTSTRIELSFNKINRVTDLADLSELLFPGNRNQQHAFLVIWISLKWADDCIVPNLAIPAEKHGVSRRTLERVRAKMRRMGLIDHVSRFSAEWGYREGWVLSGRFERALRALADKIAQVKRPVTGAKDKDEFLLQLADTRRGDDGNPVYGGQPRDADGGEVR
ncbi:hypothetical protein ES703_65478 [subsurface metagenome]